MPRKSHQLINQNSGNVEYYTPQPIIEAARAVMGSIDLDPASSTAANLRVRAGEFYNQRDNGLEQSWWGNVWLNHPFGRVANPLWVDKLTREFHAGNIIAACCLTFACTSEAWFQPLLRRPQCFLTPRTNFYLRDGTLKKGVTKGSVVTYYGNNDEKFAEVFRSLGVVKGAR